MTNLHRSQWGNGSELDGLGRRRPSAAKPKRARWAWLIPLILTLAGAIQRMPDGALGHNWLGQAADDARMALHDDIMSR